MLLEITNIGPIKKMELDLSKRLITFMGLNGTGKTYIAYIIYSLLTYNQKPFDLFSDISNQEADIWRGTIHIDDLYVWLTEHLKNIKNQLGNTFNLADGDEMFKDANLRLLTSKDEFRQQIVEREESFIVKDFLKFEKKEGSLSYTFKKLDLYNEKVVSNRSVSTLIVNSMLFNATLATMLTAERNGIYTFSKELSISRLHMADSTNVIFTKQRYPRPILDSLLKADDWVQTKKTKALTYDLALRIETQLMGGRMKITPDGALEYKPSKMKSPITFNLASSAVKTMAPIILFLKHQALPGQMLIIDEPELNLHPQNQILLARLFAKMIQAGLSLLVNTHSDYIIREMNSMMMLSALDITQRKKLGYAEDEILQPHLVGVYSFEPGTAKDERNVQVKLVPITRTGFDAKIMDDVIARQMNQAQDIYLSLDENEQ